MYLDLSQDTPGRTIIVYLFGHASKVYKVVFDMGFFGSRTKKPTMLLTNSRVMCRLHGHRMRGKRIGKGLCKKYLNSKGERAYCGAKNLKASQNLDCSLIVR